jgi:WS/DGAT/MGAT family acyltransferase
LTRVVDAIDSTPMTAQTKQMSPVDSAWLHMEEPTNLMMITGVSLLDKLPDFERFKKTLEVRLLTLDRFTMRVVEPVLPVGTPHWEADPNFDLDAHVHRVALPSPGDIGELQRFISDLASTPLDFSKPLWNIHLVENVQGGAAMVLRLHHCIGDGTAMNAVLFRLMDMTRDAPIGEVAEPPAEELKRRDFISTVFEPVRSIGNALRYLAHEGSESLRHPSRILQGAGTAAEAASIVGHVLMMSPDRQTLFKGPLGVQKRVAWSNNIPLSDVKTVTNALGTKVNDVMLAAVAGALRDYLIERDADVSDLEIRAVIPVDLRPPQRGIELGNAFGLVFLALPLSIADPVERLLETKKRMDTIKQSIEALTFYSLLGIFGVTPRQVEEQGLNVFGSRATAVVTNVRGPGQALYIAGSKIENIMGWVPQAGHLGLGVSIFSYDGKVSVGVITDAGLVPDPERITEAVRTRFDELLGIAADTSNTAS